MTDSVDPGNRSKVLRTLIAESPTTRGAVATRTGLSNATVTRTVSVLLRERLVQDLHALPRRSPGRPANLLEVCGNHTLAAGVDIGASNTRAVLFDLTGRALATCSVATPTTVNARRLARFANDLVRDMATDTQVGRTPAVIAAGVPGSVHPQTDVISNAPNLPAISGKAFVAEWRKLSHASVYLDNDANLALLGERHYGSACGVANVVMFTLGTGMGAGVMIEGHLVRGRQGGVGEFGQIPFGASGDRLELTLSGPGLMRAARDAGIALHAPAAIFDPTSRDARRDVCAQYLDALHMALVAATAASEPEIIVIGGGIAPSLGAYLTTIQARLERTYPRAAPSVLLAATGELCGAYGAGVWALQQVYRALGVTEDDLTNIPTQDQLGLFSYSEPPRSSGPLATAMTTREPDS